MLIDFHTHHPDPDKNIYNILNYDYFNGAKLPARTPFTIGLHPWWIFQSDGFWEEKVTEIFEDDYCVGFGEIGLDRSVAIDFEIQKEFFKKQLELAHELYSPYVIIHCVRAYSDLIPFIKETSYPGPFIIHDYHGNEQITQQLLKYPCFFSFGSRIMRDNPVYPRLMQMIGLKKLFLETDDQTDFDIKQIYQKASQLLEISENKLEKAIEDNYQAIIDSYES